MPVILRVGSAFTDSAIPKIQRDRIITDGCKFVYDFSDPFSWSPQRAPVDGESVVNLVRDGDTADVELSGSNTIGWSGGGFVFDAEGSTERVLFPAAATLGAGTTGLVFSTWVRHEANGAAFYAIAGNTYQTSANNQYAIAHLGTDAADTLRLYANGAHVKATGVAIGAVTQLAVAYLTEDGGSTYKVRGYKNGASVGETASVAGLNQPGVSGIASIGDLGGFNSGWVGRVYRTWLTDTGSDGSDPDALVALDYTENAGRFS